MKSDIQSALIGALFCLWLPAAQASGAIGISCTAKVLHSEELPYAPMGYWLVKATLEIVPSKGTRFVTTVQKNLPWQQSQPRKGDTFRVWCDPDSQIIYR